MDFLFTEFNTYQVNTFRVIDTIASVARGYLKVV